MQDHSWIDLIDLSLFQQNNETVIEQNIEKRDYS
jgi:hypothetical protein